MGAGVGVLALAGTFSFVSARRGKTGLSEQEPSPHSFSKCVCVCVNYLAMRAGVYCTTQVSARRLLQVCVCVILIFSFPSQAPMA